MAASVGLIALWTGELCANVEHMKDMAIHAMLDEDLDLFAKYVNQAKWSIDSIQKYVKEQQEAA
jgi:hypothetical protein